MILRLLLLVALLSTAPAVAQQAVRVKIDSPDHKIDLPAQLYRPAARQAPAVALFHGCGGPGQNTARMAELLKSWGYVALVVDSFSSRGIKDACGRNWPTQADAEKRAIDIDATGLWLNNQDYVAPGAGNAFMGYSYGGGVGLLRTLSARTDPRVPSGWRAAIMVYPDCALADVLGPKLRPRMPVMIAMGEKDDWTPVSQCQALLDRVTGDRNLIETHIYPDAHHSFDALGLPVRYLEGVGNRSKPGGCCGAHYGANEAAWKAFTADTKAFLAKHLAK